MFTSATNSIWKGAMLAAAFMLVMTGPAMAAKENVPASAMPPVQTAPPPPPSPPMPPPLPRVTPEAKEKHAAIQAALKECGETVAKDKSGHPERKAMDECMKKKKNALRAQATEHKEHKK